jgi:hypothetical protein
MAKHHLYAHPGSVVECLECDDVWYEADDLVEAVEVYIDREDGCAIAETPGGELQTSCGGLIELYAINDIRHFRFCPYCGRRLTPVGRLERKLLWKK